MYLRWLLGDFFHQQYVLKSSGFYISCIGKKTKKHIVDSMKLFGRTTIGFPFAILVHHFFASEGRLSIELEPDNREVPVFTHMFVRI